MKPSPLNKIFHSAIIILTQIYLLLFPFGQIFRFTFFRPDVHLYLTDLIVGLVDLLFFTYLVFNLVGLTHKLTSPARSSRLNLHSPLPPLLIFLLWVAFSLPLNPLRLTTSELTISGLYWFRLVGYLLFLLAISNSIQTIPQQKASLLHTFILSNTLFILLCFIQLILLPDFSILHRAGWDQHLYRLTGTLLDPGYTGLILVFIFLFYISDMFLKSSSYLNHPASLPKPFSYLLTSSTFIALLLTYSRASYLALLVGTAIISWVKNTPKLFITTFTIIVFFIAILPKPPGEGGNITRTSTVRYRLDNYQQALQIIKDHPLSGVGFNTYRYAQYRYGFVSLSQQLTSHSASGTDNSFLFVLATTGIIGFILLSMFFINLLRLLYASLPKSPRHLALFASFIALLVHSQFHNTLFYSWIIGYLSLITAITLAPPATPS